jgi:hypothetical protein
MQNTTTQHRVSQLGEHRKTLFIEQSKQSHVFIYQVKRTVATLLTAEGKAASAFCY